ncbi:Protein tweety-3 [Galemys pyrenaicus]|uniref:Protein tweety-3 n=1 Tax=Galemys pyrenaicus TaxID=202257 RepID=A0A8J6DVV1_GALPY|nr:Protein tweety-3 [Galemys pyrenaicus]
MIAVMTTVTVTVVVARKPQSLSVGPRGSRGQLPPGGPESTLGILSCRGPDEDGEEEAAPGPRQAHDSLYRVHMPSLYSCGSSYGSENSIPAAAHTVSNAPVTEYMSQNANFQNPRCENTPLIGRESPPPSRYLAALDSGSHAGWQFKPMDNARTLWWPYPQSDRY